MISISGPIFVEPGSTVCITVSGIGTGFVVTAVASGDKVPLKIKINQANHTAEICFTAPASGQAATIYASDNASADGTSHTVISR